MPSENVELYERIRLRIEALAADTPVDSPWRTVLIDHDMVRDYCLSTLEQDGFENCEGTLIRPEKYNKVVCLSDEDEICDCLEYLIKNDNFVLSL